MNATVTLHLLCEAHLFIALFLDLFRVLFIQMIEKYLEQYIYIYDICLFNEIHLEFAKVILHKHHRLLEYTGRPTPV